MLHRTPRTPSAARSTTAFWPAFASPAVQPKLTVNAPGDAFEREADRMADAVVHMPSPQDSPGAARFRLPLQRKCAACEEESLDREEVPGMEAEAGAGRSFEALLRSAGRGGAPLPDDARAFMEPRFGTEFGDVRLHTDSTAHALSTRIQAHAFTHGSDIYFRSGAFAPGTGTGKRLLAHELTHVVQQGGAAGAAHVQRDFAIEPPRPAAVGRVLTATQMQRAIAENTLRFPDPAELALVRDILGLTRDPAVVDEDFVNAIAEYQAQYDVASDGSVGPVTLALLAREVRAEAQYLTDQGAPLGALDLAFALQRQLDGFITAGNTTYADYRDAIRAATPLNRTVALVDEAFMGRLRDTLIWNNFARCAELLGRVIPDGAALLRDPTVRATLAAAWTASNPAVTLWDTHDPSPAFAGHACNPAPGAAPAAGAHEEGGWVYLNLVTGAIATRRAAAGGRAAINLNVPPPPTVVDSVIVATFHTHPNVGACWATAANPVFASPPDIANANTRGVPNLIRGAFPGVNDTRDISAGPARRQHLAGNRRFPGAGGGLAPQADVLGREPAMQE
jgi:hypothetical protein